MKLRPTLRFLAWAGLFGLAYTQAPLYYSNQNQYCLHGLAAASDGPLRDDWLANTASPTPAFDLLVRITAQFGHEYAFHGYYALLLGVYWSSLVGIFEFLAVGRATAGRKLLFAALLMLIHSALIRWASYRLFGADYPCYAQGWLAAQYVLGAVLQPSAFGVLLIAAIVQFVRNRPFLAATSLGIACIGHSTYLLPAGILTLAFAGMLVIEGRRTTALALAGIALLLVLPGMIHTIWVFRPTSQEAFAEASRILVEERIPHHCDPHRWFDLTAGLQLAWLGLSLLLIQRTRLFRPLAILAVVSLLLALIQIATGNHSLALLFPWRSSVILLPLATAIVLARMVLLAGRWVESVPSKAIAMGTMAIAVLGGIGIMVFHQGYARNAAEDPLMEFVRANRQLGDVYLLPVSVPKPGTNRGAISSDFKPLAEQRRDGGVIPVDFQRFRLTAGVPIYVDFKAIPYRDTEVLEWYRRVKWNEDLYRHRNWDETNSIAQVKAAGITHVVVARDRDVKCASLRLVYEDGDYRVYRVER